MTAASPIRLTYLVKAAELVQRSATAPILAQHRLTYAELSMLLSVARGEGASGAGLARLHGITAQSAGEVIGALGRRGLIERRPDPSHRRIRTVHLTDDGRALVDAIQPALDAIDRELSAGIDPQDLATARDVLTRISENGAAAVTGD